MYISCIYFVLIGNPRTHRTQQTEEITSTQHTRHGKSTLTLTNNILLLASKFYKLLCIDWVKVFE